MSTDHEFSVQAVTRATERSVWTGMSAEGEGREVGTEKEKALFYKLRKLAVIARVHVR